MADKEIHVPFDQINDSRTITKVNKKLFADRDLDIHKNEAVDIIDDPTLQKRVYKIRKVKYFGPWSHRG
jgi:hypothetical protein